MNFDGITAITIPEGDVKKIMRGDEILWEKVAGLICEPTMTVTKSISLTISRYNVSVVIQGIDSSLIQSLEIGTGKRSSNGVTYDYIEISYTSDGTTHRATKSYSYNATYVGFAARLTYTDLTGATRTLIASVAA